MEKLQTIDNETQNYLVFQPVFKDFKTPTNSKRIMTQKSKVISEQNIKPPAHGVINCAAPGVIFLGTKRRMKFYLKLSKASKYSF